MARPQIRRVSKAVLREKFDRLYLADVLAGRMTEVIDNEGSPNPRANQPPGTLSQRVRYFDNEGRPIAVCHRYLRPDGSLGGSGMPDPKAVLEEGMLYAAPIRPKPPGTPRKKRGGRKKRRN